MERKVRIGVIPAAGIGSRLKELPLTRILPKPMLPVLNKPIIEYVIQKMRKSGIKEIYIVVGFKREVIEDYFGDGTDFGVKIKYVVNKSPETTGIADSIYLTKKFINKPFLVVLGDDFTVEKTFRRFIRWFTDRKALAVTGVVRDKDPQSLRRTNCVVLDDDNKIIKMIEKPVNPISSIRGCGIYVFDPIVYRYIDKVSISKRGFKEITDTLDLMSKDESSYGVRLKGANININTINDLLSAMKLSLKLFG